MRGAFEPAPKKAVLSWIGCFPLGATGRYAEQRWNPNLQMKRRRMENLTNAPMLTTRRLVLRGPERDDLSEFTRFMTSAPSMKAQGETVTAEQAWFGFLTGIGHWHWHGFCFFTVALQQTGQPVGRVGLIKHSNWPDVELAWHLFEGGEGQGFATEAAMAVKKWAFEDLGLDGLHSYIDRENTRSQAVAKRLGAVTDGTQAPHEPEAEVWVHSMEGH